MIQLLCALLLVAPPQNYAPKSDAWNGLEYLQTTAAEAKVSLEMPDELDWTKVQLQHTLLFVAPGSRVRGEQILNFVTDGGHAIVALEAGGGTEILRAFGVKLSPNPVIHDNYYRDHPAFPRLLPSGEHFLWYNVEDIVLNHPTSFQIDPVNSDSIEVPIRFAEPSQAFAIELFRGSGNILFISDASLFINDMQRRSYGDKQLVANFFRYYCSGSECRLTVVPPWAQESGNYLPQGLNTLEGIENLFGRAVEELNALSIPTNESLSSKVGSQWLTLGLLLSLFVGALGMLWLENKTTQPWLQKQPPRPTCAETWSKALSASQERADFAGPAAALSDRFYRELSVLLPNETPLSGSDSPDALLQAIENHCGPTIASTAKGCMLAFAKARENATRAPHPLGITSIQEFEQLWNDSQEVILAMHNLNPGHQSTGRAA